MVGGVFLFEYGRDVIHAVCNRVFEDDVEVKYTALYGTIGFTHVLNRPQVCVVNGVQVADFQAIFVEAVYLTSTSCSMYSYLPLSLVRLRHRETRASV